MAETLTRDQLNDLVRSHVEEALRGRETSNDNGPLADLAQWAREQREPLKPDTVIRKTDAGFAIEPLKPEEQAKMRQALTAAIEDPLNSMVAGIPLGSIAVGGFAGLVLSDVVDLFADEKTGDGGVNWVNVLGKGFTAFALNQFGSQVMTRQATQFAAAVLVIDILDNVVDLGQWVRRVVDWFRRVGPVKEEQALALTEANNVANSAWNATGMRQGPNIVHPGADALAGVLGG